MAVNSTVWKSPREVDELLTAIENGETEVLEECPPTPIPGTHLSFRKTCDDDDRCKCDSYAGWRGQGSVTLREFGIRKDGSIIISQIGRFQRMVWSRKSAVIVEYYGNPEAATIRRTPRTPKVCLNQVTLLGRPQEILDKVPGLQNVAQVINKRSRLTKKIHQFTSSIQNAATNLEEYLAPYSSDDLSEELKPYLGSLQTSNGKSEWIETDVVDTTILSISDCVFPGLRWVELFEYKETVNPLACILHLSAPKFFLVPVRFENHFMLAIVIPNSIILVDSYYTEREDSFYEPVFKDLIWIGHGAAYVNGWDTIRWKCLIMKDFMEQEDETECGVIVALSALAFVRGWDMPEAATIAKQARNRRWMFQQCRKQEYFVPYQQPVKKHADLVAHLQTSDMSIGQIYRENVGKRLQNVL